MVRKYEVFRFFRKQINISIFSSIPKSQPYSRNNETSKRDDVDPRSKSFLHLCQLLKEMIKSNLPKMILMENVFGFESVRSLAYSYNFIITLGSF